MKKDILPFFNYKFFKIFFRNAIFRYHLIFRVFVFLFCDSLNQMVKKMMI